MLFILGIKTLIPIVIKIIPIGNPPIFRSFWELELLVSDVDVGVDEDDPEELLVEEPEDVLEIVLVSVDMVFII